MNDRIYSNLICKYGDDFDDLIECILKAEEEGVKRYAEMLDSLNDEVQNHTTKAHKGKV